MRPLSVRWRVRRRFKLIAVVVQGFRRGGSVERSSTDSSHYHRAGRGFAHRTLHPPLAYTATHSTRQVASHYRVSLYFRSAVQWLVRSLLRASTTRQRRRPTLLPRNLSRLPAKIYSVNGHQMHLYRTREGFSHDRRVLEAERKRFSDLDQGATRALQRPHASAPMIALDSGGALPSPHHAMRIPFLVNCMRSCSRPWVSRPGLLC